MPRGSLIPALALLVQGVVAQPVPYAVVDTGQYTHYDATSPVSAPAPGAPFHGQDAAHAGRPPSFRDNGDGTVTDLVTGLMWQADPGGKMTWAKAVAGADAFRLAGYDDWRLPTVKELYSLIDFRGTDPSGCPSTFACPDLRPFIDTDVFAFRYGDESKGERLIDAQYASSTVYVGTVMNDQRATFGVNFADGRIKGYPTGPTPVDPGGKGYFVLHVRGNPEYGVNDLVANGDGTVTDRATGLVWMRDDSGHGLSWEDALAWCETATLADHDDWRLPDVKELQSIVDYTRSPATSGTAAIDPVFSTTAITNEAGERDFPYFWSSTTHANAQISGTSAAYVAFGTAPGFFMGSWRDVHGAGAQRSDPKTGDASDFPRGHGPQGDAIRILDFARCVR